MPGVPANVPIVYHPGALAWLGAVLQPALGVAASLASALSAAGAILLVGAAPGPASDGDPTRLYLLVALILYLISELSKRAIELKKGWRAADAGTVQAELAAVKDQLADAEAARDRHKTFSAEAIAARQELYRQLTEANAINRELMSDLREARREAAEARRDLAAATSRANEHANRTSDEVTQTNRLLVEKVAPRTTPAGPIEVVIAPESEPVSVREVDGGKAPADID